LIYVKCPQEIWSLVSQCGRTEGTHSANQEKKRALEREMDIMRRHWLDYDPVALAVLIIGIGIVELLALVI